MGQALPLTSETVGQLLDKEDFSDLYQQVWEHGHRYFPRVDQKGQIDLVIVFDDIDDFSQSSGSQVMIDFKRYKNQFLVVIWTLNDPIHPLGFPISFNLDADGEWARLQKLFAQEKIWIHYLANEGEELIHIFSEAYEIPDEEKQRIPERLTESIDEGDADSVGDVRMDGKEADKLLDRQLLADGIGYALDFSAMISKGDEEQAKEKLINALLQSVLMIKKHPRPEVREAEFLLWVTEKREVTSSGEDARLSIIYMTPPLHQHFGLIHGEQQDENPLTSVLLSLPEFLMTIEESPIQQGAFPILEYDKGDIYQLELDEGFQARLAQFYQGNGQNPYLLD